MTPQAFDKLLNRYARSTIPWYDWLYAIQNVRA